MNNNDNKITLYEEKLLAYMKKAYPEKWGMLKYENKDKWITREDYPTYEQLVEIVKLYNIHFFYIIKRDKNKFIIPIELRPGYIRWFLKMMKFIRHKIGNIIYDIKLLFNKNKEVK